ncbi:DUF5372 family protein [Streptomyces sp. NPDC089919]|uniref:DUF5372 family protein n=1 Tax=Streptomyces sp. NPDC089919 TaxID=3155188 RepID=UPI00342240AB
MTGDRPAGPGQPITVTHPSHPLRGRRLHVRAVHGRGLAEALICDGPDGRPVTVLRSWTDDHHPAPPFRVSERALGRLRSSVAAAVGRRVGLDGPAEHPPRTMEFT